MPISASGRSRIMASIRGRDTGPEILLRKALHRAGVRGWRCNWPDPTVRRGEIDVAFPRWRLAVFVDGSFWHGHPSKWQPGRWSGYWDEKIRRNIERDVHRNRALRLAGWRVLRLWDFEIEEDADAAAAVVAVGLGEQKAQAVSSASPQPMGPTEEALLAPVSFGEQPRQSSEERVSLP